MATVIAAELLGTRMLPASSTRTVTAGAMGWPATDVVGCWPKAIFAGGPMTTSRPVTVGLLGAASQSAPRNARILKV